MTASPPPRDPPPEPHLTTPRQPDSGGVRRNPHFWPGAAVIVAATAAVAALGGMVSSGEADPWYATLNRAPGNPPGWVFGVVWPVLYGLMAAGAVMVWRAVDNWKEGQLALGLFAAQLVFNLAWSYLFFGLHLPLIAFADLCMTWVATALMMRAFTPHSRLAAMMQVPYLIWLSFAAYLNGWVAIFN